MRISDTTLDGVKLVDSQRHDDERGWFMRSADMSWFREAGLPGEHPHHNLSWNRSAGTLRGLHFQAPPGEESKLVRCVAGAMYDVVVDMRRSSATFGRWEAFELTDPSRAVHIPAGCAHGFQTLADETLVLYLMGDVYRPEQQRRVPFDDPTLGIPWPRPERIMSAGDLGLPAYDWSRDWTDA